MSVAERDGLATLDQRRARHAWSAVIRARGEASFEDYAGEAKKFPVSIMTAGLGQALAFVRAKKRSGSLLDDVGGWVLGITIANVDDSAGGDSLLQEIIGRDADFLRQATDEAQSYLRWLNRFAEAESKGTGLFGGD